MNIIKQKALYFLARREYSYQELFNKLKKYSDDYLAIKQVLDEMVEKKFLSEERYIASFIRSKNQKYGLQKIKYQLTTKVTDEAIIDQLINEAEIDELSIARNIWQKKFGNLTKDTKELAKQARFLYSRGFSFEIIKKIIYGAKEE